MTWPLWAGSGTMFWSVPQFTWSVKRDASLGTAGVEAGRRNSPASLAPPLELSLAEGSAADRSVVVGGPSAAGGGSKRFPATPAMAAYGPESTAVEDAERRSSRLPSGPPVMRDAMGEDKRSSALARTKRLD